MRLIDADALKDNFPNARADIFENCRNCTCLDNEQINQIIDSAPTIGGWISVKDKLPEEHPSMFDRYYDTPRWDKSMWRMESDRVLVVIRFPDGTRTVDKGKLQDGMWRTGVSPVLQQEVTHWAVWPEPPKEDEPNDA